MCRTLDTDDDDDRHHDADGTEPTTGFHAVLMFGLACKSVDLYGYMDSGTQDGHVMHSSHGIEKEHALYGQLLRGERIAHMPDAMRDAWAAANVSLRA